MQTSLPAAGSAEAPDVLLDFSARAWLSFPRSSEFTSHELASVAHRWRVDRPFLVAIAGQPLRISPWPGTVRMPASIATTFASSSVDSILVCRCSHVIDSLKIFEHSLIVDAGLRAVCRLLLPLLGVLFMRPSSEFHNVMNSRRFWLLSSSVIQIHDMSDQPATDVSQIQILGSFRLRP
ncbi:hypothetical protein FKP32DRAFT_511104 [Trametes sanguinea]|nr:hypothetical protein FKP32DRAFT_511104 [Trametes sanguinea]